MNSLSTPRSRARDAAAVRSGHPRRRSRRAAAVLFALAFVSAATASSLAPARADDASPTDASARFAAAEAAWVDGRDDRALDAYRVALESALAGIDATTSVEVRRDLVAEVDLALRRLYRLGRETARSADVAATFQRWADDGPGVDAVLAALARQFAGSAALAARGDVEEARRIWAPLGTLEAWRVVGPFDNERGGGFLTPYGPEKGIDFDARYEGKLRDVAWRELPARPLAGAVDFDELLRPNDEALAYAVTFVHSDRDQVLALRAGSDEGVRAWVNGRLIASEDVQRQRRFDQSAHALPLRAGWNCILLKVAEQKGTWAFSARISALDGMPAAGWREAESGPEDSSTFSQMLEAVRTLEASSELSPLGPRPARGAVDALEARIAARPDDARAHYLLGAIVGLAGGHDVSQHPDTAALRRAVEIDERPAIHHIELARSFRGESAIAAQRDDNDWRVALEAAAARGSSRALLELAEYYVETFGNLGRGAQLVAQALARDPDDLAAIVWRSRIEARRRFSGAVTRGLAAARRVAPESATTLRLEAELLRLESRAAERAAVLERLLARDHLDSATRSQLVGVLFDLGRRDDARAVLEKLRELEPLSAGVDERLATIALGEDDPRSAAAHLVAALRVRPEDHEILDRLGRARWELDLRDAAFAAWDHSLELQPNQPDLRERVEYLRETKDRFDVEFRRDAAAIAKAARAENYANEAGDPARVLLEVVAVEVNQDGTSREFTQQVVEVLNDAGIRDWDQFVTAYAAGEQQLEFRAARVFRKDGSTEEARLPRFGASSGSLWRRAAVDLPPLTAGDIVEVAYVREDIEQSFFGDYFGRRELFRGSLPLCEKVFTLRAPAERRFYFHQRHLATEPERSVDEESRQVTWTWALHDVPKLDSEPAMPPEKEILPLVEVSTFESWDTFNGWYWNLIKKQFESSPEIDRKVAELTSGKDTELEKIRALYNFVVTDIRYNAWEFGVHGFKPYNASKVFARRFGDCKDKATLLSVMMDRAGVEAHPVLIFADQRRGEEDLTLPMVNHFNHCITYVPPADGRAELFLDGTATFHSVEELPSMDRGARVLIVGAEGAIVKDVPWNTPADLAIDEEWDVRLRADLSATIEMRLRARGDFGVSLRRTFEIEAQRREQLELSLGQRFAGATVTDSTFSDLRNLDEPVTMRVAFRVPKLATPSPEGTTLAIPDDFFRSASSLSVLGALEVRQTDLVLGNPRSSTMRIVLRLPDGLRVKSLPVERDQSTRFGRLRLAARAEDPRSVVIEREVALSAPRVPRAEYDAFRDIAAAIDIAAKEKIVLAE